MIQSKLGLFTGICVVCSLALVSCGGGGQSPNTQNTGNNSPTPILPNLITSSAIVDVNGDGKNDVIIGSQGGGYSSPIILINNGNGSSFTKNTSGIPSQYKAQYGSATDIKAGDFNKDGKVDLLVVVVDTTPPMYSSAQIRLFLGNGNGSFSDASANITESMSPTSSTSPLYCFPGTTWPEFLRVADIDGDGSLDFVATSPTECGGVVYHNDGTGKFTPANITITNGLVTATYTSLAMVNAGTPSRRLTDVLAGDLNNDGKIDLFAPSYSTGNAHSAFINTSVPGAISFTLVSSVTADSMKNGVLLDINGDGFLDVVGSMAVSGTTGTVPVTAFLGNGLGGFTENNTVFATQPNVVHAREFLAADVNGDGKQDVLIASHGYDAGTFPGERNWLLINNGAGQLVDHTATSLDLLPAYTHRASFGDLNGDGKPDILLNNSTACDGVYMTCAIEPRFWLNNGVGVFTSLNPFIQ